MLFKNLMIRAEQKYSDNNITYYTIIIIHNYIFKIKT